jgi:hypothetical protein
VRLKPQLVLDEPNSVQAEIDSLPGGRFPCGQMLLNFKRCQLLLMELPNQIIPPGIAEYRKRGLGARCPENDRIKSFLGDGHQHVIDDKRRSCFRS